MSELPKWSLLRFHRGSATGELGYGDVKIAGHITVRFRLLSHGEDVYLVGPTMQGPSGTQEIAKPSSVLREAMLEAFLAEHRRGGRIQSCRRCGAPITWELGRPVNPDTLAAHVCRGAA